VFVTRLWRASPPLTAVGLLMMPTLVVAVAAGANGIVRLLRVNVSNDNIRLHPQC